MKGVILAGGTGSRLDPLTKITNKHLLPVGDKPMVQWAVDTLGAAGIEDVMLVTGADHVDDFERLLGKDLRYGRQQRAGGIAVRHFPAEPPCSLLISLETFDTSTGTTHLYLSSSEDFPIHSGAGR